MFFPIRSGAAIHHLHKCLEEISKPSPLDGTTQGCSQLEVDCVDITPTILALLFRVLNQPLQQQQSPTTTTGSKWDDVRFKHCRFEKDDHVDPSHHYNSEDSSSGKVARLLPWKGKWGFRQLLFQCLISGKKGDVSDTTGLTADVSDISSPDDAASLLGATLARRTKSLSLLESPQILECLLSYPESEIEDFFLGQSVLTSLECQKLGDWLQTRSVATLKSLHLHLNDVEAQMLVESLGNAIHLQQLRINDKNRIVRYHRRGQPSQQAVSNVIVKPGGNDIVLRLLQNPQSRLRKLQLGHTGLEDSHFMAILDILPASQLELLDVRGNKIQSQAILAFAAQLARIKFLKVADLADNPWEDNWVQSNQCFAALLQGMLENDSVERLSTRDRSPLAKLVRFYCHLNYAGRRFLTTTNNNTVPSGLWPFLLERAGKDMFEKWRPDAIFFFVQSGPVLSLICSYKSNESSKQTRSES